MFQIVVIRSCRLIIRDAHLDLIFLHLEFLRLNLFITFLPREKGW